MSQLGRAFDKELILAELTAEISRFSELLGGADFAAEIAACPGWTVENLGRHMGEVHRWAVGNLASLERSAFDDEGPTGRDAVIAWFTDGASELRAALAAVDPAAPCWGFGAVKSAEFWFRRQLHEIFVHRIDLEVACDQPSSRDPAIAADGIAEAFEVMFPRMVARGLGPTLLAPVSFRATDTGDEWVIAVDNTVSRGGSSDAVIEGPAEALLLLAWQRTSLADSRLSTCGGRAEVDAVLSGRLTP